MKKTKTAIGCALFVSRKDNGERMSLFLLCYIIIAVAVIVSVFLLSYNEKKNNSNKIALTVIYILSIIGVFVSMAIFEGRYSYSRLSSSVLAAAVIGAMYIADTIGGKLADKKEGTD